MVEILNALAGLLLWPMAIVATLFALLYGLLTRWNATAASRTTLVSAIALALLIDVSVLSPFIRDCLTPTAAALIVLAILLMIFAGSLYQLVVLLRLKWRERQAARSNIRNPVTGRHPWH